MPQRLTEPTRRLLEVMLEDPTRDYYGFELMERAKLRSGTAYPLLHRLRDDGWLTSVREDVDPSEAGRPRRQLYRLTGLGVQSAQGLLGRGERARVSLPAALRPGVVGLG